VFPGVGLLLVPWLANEPTLGIVLAGGALLVLLTLFRPAWAMVGFLAVNPLLAGFTRGELVPGLRPNEVLLLPILGGLALVVLSRWSRSSWRLPRGFHPLDVAVVSVAFTGSVSTLLWMYARGRDIMTDDVQYAAIVWKLVVLYAVARVFFCEIRVIWWALTAVLITALMMGAVGTLQAIGIGPVIDALGAWIPPEEGGYGLTGNRATSTLGNPIAYGDVMIYATVIAASLALRASGRGRLLWVAAAALAVAALASGQVSIAVGLVIAGTVFALATRTVKQAAFAGLGLLAVALTVLQPVLAARLSDEDPQTGLPESWTGPHGRLENLRRYFWTDIGVDYNWLFGVRTAGRVPADESWRDWVYIENGYIWAVWTGGLPLLVAVLALIVAAAGTGRRLASSSEPVTAAIGTTVATVAWTLAGLLLFDPHLTFRGGGELLFVLLALGATLDAADRQGGGTQPMMGLQPPVPDGVHAERDQSAVNER
jgi:hypothetical protein